MTRDELAKKIPAYMQAIRLGSTDEGVTKLLMKDVDALVAAEVQRERNEQTNHIRLSAQRG